MVYIDRFIEEALILMPENEGRILEIKKLKDAAKEQEFKNPIQRGISLKTYKDCKKQISDLYIKKIDAFVKKHKNEYSKNFRIKFVEDNHDKHNYEVIIVCIALECSKGEFKGTASSRLAARVQAINNSGI